MQPLVAAALRRRCDPNQFAFASTAELVPLDFPLGQERALEALQLGIHIRRQGYHIFACGPHGLGRHHIVHQELARVAASLPVPDDWCYLHNFKQGNAPRALRLPAGRGAVLQRDMQRLVEDMQTALPAAFSREENRSRQEDIEEEFQERQRRALMELHERAAAQGILLIETPTGFAFVPRAENGEAMHPTAFQQLPAPAQAEYKQKIEALQEELQRTVRQFPIWFKEIRERLKALNQEIAEFVVRHAVEELLTRYAGIPEVVEHLRLVSGDIVENAAAFMPAPSTPPGIPQFTEAPDRGALFQRYAVNLFVDNCDLTAAPVISLDLPSLGNLLGRIEHRAQMGTFMTDFTLVKAGALHRANGGFLIVDARQLLLQPFAWEALKRVLRAREVRLDAAEVQFSLLTTVSIEPAPIPINVKVVLVGDRWLLYALENGDPEFRDLFKVIADFDDEVPRVAANELAYARVFAHHARTADTRHLAPSAVATLIEQCARMSEDALRLSTHSHRIEEIIVEADYWAERGARSLITDADIKHAIAKQHYRVDRPGERFREGILRGIKLIATTGAIVGQINGLSVISMNSHAFGLPSRITVTSRLGSGKVLDIERETELGGPLHSKGVLILASFLATRFTKEAPLALSASITFEQSYGPVDGDSASLAELCALLSSVSGIPLFQHLAVTGSVNQHGEVQAIGGVNEKIEGFFDVCNARGLAAGQGVLIPAANREHLMLREDVVDAAAAGKFFVYAVSTVDEAMELLTGRIAGTASADGEYPLSSVNQAVAVRLAQLAQLQRSFAEKKSEHERDHE